MRKVHEAEINQNFKSISITFLNTAVFILLIYVVHDKLKIKVTKIIKFTQILKRMSVKHLFYLIKNKTQTAVINILNLHILIMT